MGLLGVSSISISAGVLYWDSTCICVDGMVARIH